MCSDRLLRLVLLVLLGACGSRTPAHDYAQEPDPRTAELVLGVGDVVAINVWENPDLSTETTVRPDGTITMPLVGDLKARGETPTALRELIKRRVQEFVKLEGIEVTVAVKEWKSYKFTVQGEVARQGVFQSDSFVTVAEALAMAGGLTRFAKRGDIRIFRRDVKTSEVRQIPIDYNDLTSGSRLDMNIWILPGDTVSVP